MPGKPDPSNHPFFSIIIPTRNEAEDILATLKSIQACAFKEYEVLVVDASSDETPGIVREFGRIDPRFQLVPQDNKDGRCGARNQGILQARSEIVIILNADVRLTVDFLDRIKKHYDAGADYLIIDSRVENTNHPFGLMVEVIHQYLYREGREQVNWTEGFSCRRQAAIDCGLFPVGMPIPMCAGEDAIFGDNMARSYKRAEDWSICVPHRVPETWKGFWGTRSEKGRGVPMRRYWIDKWPFSQILRESLYWSGKSILWVLLVFPWISSAIRWTRPFPEFRNHWPKLLIPILFNRISHEIGRWQGFVRVWKVRNVPCRQTSIPKQASTTPLLTQVKS
jgi:glycosyltransferase involved in cell wall biosynthesis